MPWPKALHCEQTKTKNKNTANYESQFFVFETPTQSRCGTWRGKVITARAHATLFFCAMSTTSFLNPEPLNPLSFGPTQRTWPKPRDANADDTCAHIITLRMRSMCTLSEILGDPHNAGKVPPARDQLSIKRQSSSPQTG